MEIRMLYDIETGKEITYLPHHNEFRIWRKGLSDDEYNAIIQKLNSMIDADEIHTASWMPGNKWEGTVFEPIHTKACGMNRDDSGLFFGLLVWHVFQSRDDEWYFGKFSKDGFPIKGMTYFRKKD